MKNFKKMNVMRLARKTFLYAIPALALVFGSCSNEDEVIELTSGDLAIVPNEQLDPEYDSSPDHFMKVPAEKSMLPDGEAETGIISSSGPVRLILSSSTNFSGGKMRFWTSNPTTTQYTYTAGPYYYKSIVIPPYMNVKLTNDLGTVKWYYNSSGSSASYIPELTSDFTASGRYINRVDVYVYNQKTTQQFCGFAYTGTNYSGKRLSIFRSTSVAETQAEGYGFNYFDSFRAISDSDCSGVSFSDTDIAVNDNSSTVIDGVADNSDLGGQPDAFYANKEWDDMGLDDNTFTTTDSNNMIDGYALGVSDGSTTASQQEKDACLAGYRTCRNWMTALGAVSMIAAKITCAGYSSMASLATNIISAIANEQYYLLGTLIGDAAKIVASTLIKTAYPFGQVGAGICIFAIVVKGATGVTSYTLCNSLKTKCDDISVTTQQD